MNIFTDVSLSGLGPIGWLVVWAMAVLALAVQIMFAVAVFRDAEQIVDDGGRTVFVTGAWWTVAVLLGSLPAVALYWAMHHSTLRQS